jgi:hypothetical protein
MKGQTVCFNFNERTLLQYLFGGVNMNRNGGTPAKSSHPAREVSVLGEFMPASTHT